MARKRTIIVGDIHGMLPELQNLLVKCAYRKNVDRLIFAGDLVDRGPDSAGVVAFAMKLNAEVTIGNHDEKYIRYRRNDRIQRKKRNTKSINSASEKQRVWHSLTYEHIDFLETQPYCISLEEYNTYVVHAGVLPERPIEKQTKETYLYTRYVHKETHKRLHLMRPNFTQPPNSVHWTEIYEGKADIIYGHDVQSTTDPVIAINSSGARTIGLDTGACFGGKLTAVVYSEKSPRGEFVQIQSKKYLKEYKVVKRNI
jgi:predicted phosphodiesterase